MAFDKVVDSTDLDTKLTAIANAIRGVNGATKTYTIGEMSDAITAIGPVVTVYTGSGEPSSSLGSDGDLYLDMG